ncbi:MAG: TIGR04002 family protein [Clostridia bacterium]|nr:TIGR04002 family protein [Clostridia bacterium]
MRKKESLYKKTYTAIFSAIILLSTMLIKFSTGMGEGYIHFGDCFIYLSACILPFPYCLIAGAVGGAFADILGGFAVWSFPTAIIKILISLPFMVACKNDKSNKIFSGKTALMTLVSGVISILGYFIAECILYSVASATLSIIGNTIQAVASGILFIIFASALDKMNFKSKLFKGV